MTLNYYAYRICSFTCHEDLFRVSIHTHIEGNGLLRQEVSRLLHTINTFEYTTSTILICQRSATNGIR